MSRPARREPLAMRAFLDNGFRHGEHVRVTIRPHGDRWRSVVADDAPGIAEHYLDPLLRRFGGDLHASNAPDGGLVVRVTVPGAGADGGRAGI